MFQEQFFDFEIIMSNDYTKIAMDRKLHELKIRPEYFEAIETGEKNFEVRYNDHNFAKGDILLLREHDGNCYTGRQITTEVTYLLDNPAYCKEGFVIMAIKKLETKLLVSAKKAPMVR